jgi:hypothetical protein
MNIQRDLEIPCRRRTDTLTIYLELYELKALRDSGNSPIVRERYRSGRKWIAVASDLWLQHVIYLSIRNRIRTRGKDARWTGCIESRIEICIVAVGDQRKRSISNLSKELAPANIPLFCESQITRKWRNRQRIGTERARPITRRGDRNREIEQRVHVCACLCLCEGEKERARR